MKSLILVQIYSVCILQVMSLSQVTAQSLLSGEHVMSIVPNFNVTSVPFPTNSSSDSSHCDFSSYPDFCIPYPPPKLNCDNVDAKDFTVFPPAPHRFDRDKDGEGCETSE
jgi:hypothetical protein